MAAATLYARPRVQGRLSKRTRVPPDGNSNRDLVTPLACGDLQAPDNSKEFEKFHRNCNCKLFATRYTVSCFLCDSCMDATVSSRANKNTSGWRRTRGRPPLAEVFGSIATRPTGSLGNKLLAFLGPGYLVAVGYMDPPASDVAQLPGGPSSDTRCSPLRCFRT